MMESKAILAKKADFYNRYTFLICTSLLAIMILVVFYIVAYYDKHYKYGSLLVMLTIPFFMSLISITISKRTDSYKIMLAVIAGYSKEYINLTRVDLQLHADNLSSMLGIKPKKIAISFDQESYFSIPQISLYKPIIISNKALTELSKEEFDFMLIWHLLLPRYLYQISPIILMFIIPTISLSKDLLIDFNIDKGTAINLVIFCYMLFFIPLFSIIIYSFSSKHEYNADKKALLATKNLDAAISAVKKMIAVINEDYPVGSLHYKRIDRLKKIAAEKI